MMRKAKVIVAAEVDQALPIGQDARVLALGQFAPVTHQVQFDALFRSLLQALVDARSLVDDPLVDPVVATRVHDTSGIGPCNR
jgi:hypothetical protein